MSKNILYALFIFGFMSCSESEDDLLKLKIKQFYIRYSTDMSPANAKKYSVDTLNKYFTSYFIEHMEQWAEECDCDPIVQGQDYIFDPANNIAVWQVEGNSKKYAIRQVWNHKLGYSDTMFVKLIKEGGIWKINEVEYTFR